MTIFRSLTGLLLVSALVACGGGTGNPSQEAQSERRATEVSVAANPDLTSGKAEGLESPSYGTPVEGTDLALMKQRLAQRFNGRFAGQPEALMGDRQKNVGPKAFQRVAKAYGRTPAPVHRFFNIRTGAHFYTRSNEEKEAIELTLPQFSYEGQAFFVLDDYDVPLSPVYRFYSIYTGTHFYTIDTEEMYFVRTNYAEYFNFEGVAWWATTYAGPGWVPMHRFFNTLTSTHFYTNSEDERLRVIETAPFMEYEGIGYYVRANGSQLPVSPVSHSRTLSCIGPVGLYDEVCSLPGSLPTHLQVEGRRPPPPHVVRDRFDVVGNCALDTYTGLVWEIKSTAGIQDHALRFTHLDRTDQLQVMTRSDLSLVPRVPTEAEILSETNSQGYVNRINSIALCGYTDWRLPKASELVNVIDFSMRKFEFPGFYSGRYLTADSVAWNHDVTNGTGQTVRHSVNGTVGVTADFQPVMTSPNFSRPMVDVRHRAEENSGEFVQTEKFSIVLVRGTKAPELNRFSLLSLPYGRDQPNNAVLDNWTHLQWRRCLEGQSWNGVACTGSPLLIDLYAALSTANNHPGWRVPGIKELDSLYRWNAPVGQPFIDGSALPTGGAVGQGSPLWSASIYSPITDPLDGVVKTPAYQASSRNSGVGIPEASVKLVARDHNAYVRLTRVHP